MYRSSYGPTVDGLQKPEVIAPSIWVPAPILPNTPTAQQAELLKTLDEASDDSLHTIIESDIPALTPSLMRRSTGRYTASGRS